MAMARMRDEQTDLPETGLAARLAARRDQYAGRRRASRRASCRPISRSCRSARRGFHALLPAQSKAVPADRRFRRRAIGACRRWPTTSISAPTCRATGSGATARWSTSRTTSMRWWRDDLVTFAIGCSFSFEQALMEDGIELRHITCDCTVPMYRTSIETAPAGPFHGPLVVSMRPMKPADAIRAVQITTRFPVGARRAGASRQAGADRHQGYRASRTTAMPCRSATTRCRCSGPAA